MARGRFCADVARALILRVAAGEGLAAVCAEPGMPSARTVRRWAKRSELFGRALRAAREAAGWRGVAGEGGGLGEGGGAEGEAGAGGALAGPWGPWGAASDYSPAVAAEVFARVCAGEPLSAVCEDPRMPGMATVARWRAEAPGFGAAMGEARRVCAERLVEAGWAIASAVTPADAYATRVKLEQLRWTAGCYDPGRFGRFRAVAREEGGWGGWDGSGDKAAAAKREPVKTVFCFREFRVEEQPDGTRRVVSYLRNHATGALEREVLGPTDEPVSRWGGGWNAREWDRRNGRG